MAKTNFTEKIVFDQANTQIHSIKLNIVKSLMRNVHNAIFMYDYHSGSLPKNFTKFFLSKTKNVVITRDFFNQN